MFAEFTPILYFDPFQLAVRLQLLPLRHDQRRGKLPFRANQHHLVHKARPLDRLLDRLRRDVFTARRLEQLFLSIRDSQKPVGIKRAYVARLEPTTIREHSARLVRLVVITAHDVWTTHFDLAVAGNPYVHMRDRPANRTDTKVVHETRRDHWRRFGQTVTLNDRNAGADVDVDEIIGERGAARNQQPNASAKRRMPLRENQPHGNRM